MASRKSSSRSRIGRISVYEHHGAWYTYFTENGRPVRTRVGNSRAQAECRASLLNAKQVAEESGLSLVDLMAGVLGPLAKGEGGIGPLTVTVSADTRLPTVNISVSDLRRQFLDHHDHVLNSSPATITRYGSATQYLVDFHGAKSIRDVAGPPVELFVKHLRTIEVSPNGHANTAKRKLRDKGIRYILECCRSMYHFGIRQGLLSKDLKNPFTLFGVGKLKIRDAKPIFVFNPEQEIAFFRAAGPWSLAIQFVLAKTGLRSGELSHLLIEDVDLNERWLHVSSKPELGWSVKTNRDRRVPLVNEVVIILRRAIGARKSGPAFLREKFNPNKPNAITGNREALVRAARQRIEQARSCAGCNVTRKDEHKIFETVWRDAGAVPEDRIRTNFIAIAGAVGLTASCPKSWRHTFATLLQEANVDPLVRQETLGHKPSSPDMSALGMTGTYTHTSPEFQRREIERAVRLRPASLELIQTLFTEPKHEL